MTRWGEAASLLKNLYWLNVTFNRSAIDVVVVPLGKLQGFRRLQFRTTDEIEDHPVGTRTLIEK